MNDQKPKASSLVLAGFSDGQSSRDAYRAATIETGLAPLKPFLIRCTLMANDGRKPEPKVARRKCSENLTPKATEPSDGHSEYQAAKMWRSSGLRLVLAQGAPRGLKHSQHRSVPLHPSAKCNRTLLTTAFETAQQHHKLGARCGIYRQAHNEKVTIDELSHLFEGEHLDFCIHITRTHCSYSCCRQMHRSINI